MNMLLLYNITFIWHKSHDTGEFMHHTSTDSFVVTVLCDFVFFMYYKGPRVTVVRHLF